MQENVERRTVALTVNASKLTGRVLAKALAALLCRLAERLKNDFTKQDMKSEDT